MSAGLEIPNGAEVPRAGAPSGVRWLLPGLTLLLAALAAFQLVFLVPRCLWVMQHMGARPSGSLGLMASIPEWLPIPAALAVGGFAVWQRNSVGRSALLATAALAVNVGVLVGILGNLFAVLARVPAP